MHTVGDRFPGLHAYSGYSQGCMLGRLLAHCSPSLPPSRGGSRTDWYRSTSIPVGCCTRSSLPQDATGMLQRSSQQHHSSITAASSVLPALALLALLGQDGLQHHYSSTTASLQQHVRYARNVRYVPEYYYMSLRARNAQSAGNVPASTCMIQFLTVRYAQNTLDTPQSVQCLKARHAQLCPT